jgi:hypothetical protein
MAINLEDIRLNYPFITCIKVGKEEYLGIIQNSDSKVVSIYNYDIIPPHLKTLFLEYGNSWWWESNRKLPINIFIGDTFDIFRRYLVSFSMKETEIIFGPVVQLHELTQSKRIRKKTVQLVRRVN